MKRLNERRVEEIAGLDNKRNNRPQSNAPVMQLDIDVLNYQSFIAFVHVSIGLAFVDGCLVFWQDIDLS